MVTPNEAIMNSNLHMENPRKPGECVILQRNGYYREIRGQLRIPMKFKGQFILVTSQMLPDLYVQRDCPFCHGISKDGPASIHRLATATKFKNNGYHKTYMGKDN